MYYANDDAPTLEPKNKQYDVNIDHLIRFQKRERMRFPNTNSPLYPETQCKTVCRQPDIKKQTGGFPDRSIISQNEKQRKKRPVCRRDPRALQKLRVIDCTSSGIATNDLFDSVGG